MVDPMARRHPHMRGRVGARNAGGSPVGIVYLLDLLTGGTFARTTASHYQTGASSLALAAIDARCIEDVGGAEGALISLERGWDQLIDTPNDITGSGWTAKGSAATTTTDAGDGPDGDTEADRSEVAGTGVSGAYAAFNTNASLTSSAPYTASLWVRAYSGTSAHQFTWWRSTTVGQRDYQASIGETWQRRQLTDAGAGTTLQFFIHEGRVVSGLGTIAVAADILSDFHNACAGRYALRPVDADGPATLGADTLTFTAWDERMLTDKRAYRIYPKWATTDLVSGDVRWLESWDGGNDGVRIRHDGTAPLVEVLDGGSVVMASDHIGSVAKHGEHRITIDLPGARVTHNETGGPVGTTPDWGTPTNLRIGGVYGGASELDGRITAPYLGDA